jgi:hypothetical protein
VLDARIIDPWPQEVVDALNDLRQGDVIPWPPDTAYVTTDRHILYGDQPEGDTDATGAQELVALDPAPELAVITSQTCDIDEEGRPRRKPWILYAPLFKASRTRAWGSLRSSWTAPTCLLARGTPTCGSRAAPRRTSSSA